MQMIVTQVELPDFPSLQSMQIKAELMIMTYTTDLMLTK